MNHIVNEILFFKCKLNKLNFLNIKENITNPIKLNKNLISYFIGLNKNNKDIEILFIYNSHHEGSLTYNKKQFFDSLKNYINLSFDYFNENFKRIFNVYNDQLVIDQIYLNVLYNYFNDNKDILKINDLLKNKNLTTNDKFLLINSFFNYLKIYNHLNKINDLDKSDKFFNNNLKLVKENIINLYKDNELFFENINFSLLNKYLNIKLKENNKIEKEDNYIKKFDYTQLFNGNFKEIYFFFKLKYKEVDYLKYKNWLFVIGYNEDNEKEFYILNQKIFIFYDKNLNKIKTIFLNKENIKNLKNKYQYKIKTYNSNYDILTERQCYNFVNSINYKFDLSKNIINQILNEIIKINNNLKNV